MRRFFCVPGWVCCVAVGLVLGLEGGCTPEARKGGALDPALAPPDTSAALSPADSSAVPPGIDYGGLEKVFPEIVQYEAWYREGLQAVWNDDLGLADARTGQLDSVLAEADDDDPLARIYYQNLDVRVEKLKDLVLEQRTLQSYLDKVDSLSVIGPEGAVDSTALSNLLERRHEPAPSSPRYDLQLVENPLTDRWINFFTGDGRHYMDLWLGRLPRYRDHIQSVLTEYNLPPDLIYLAMIESGLSMKAHSSANAVGTWQFIADTGRLYDLRIDWWVDERRNLEKSTRAAASHLSDLYESFGSWPLALAAYNCGARRVEKAIHRHGTRDFWKLTSLPSQTRNYVPKFMAALYIAKDPKRYHFDAAAQPRYTYDIVTVEDATDLQMIAELCDCTLEDILDLNPHVRRWCTPPNERYEVRVPEGKGVTCAERIAQIPPEERITWRRHRVRRGDTPVSLAKQYSTTVQAIADANRISTKKNLRPGVYVIVPVVPTEPNERVAQYIAQAAKSASAASVETRTRTYVVRRGDTLSSISRRHHVSVAQIMKWNGKRSAHIRVGERLRIQAPVAQ